MPSSHKWIIDPGREMGGRHCKPGDKYESSGGLRSCLTLISKSGIVIWGRGLHGGGGQVVLKRGARRLRLLSWGKRWIKNRRVTVCAEWSAQCHKPEEITKRMSCEMICILAIVSHATQMEQLYYFAHTFWRHLWNKTVFYSFTWLFNLKASYMLRYM